MTDRQYSDPAVQRRYDLAYALIRVKSYRWGNVDAVADKMTQADIDAFNRVIAALNEQERTK